MSGVHALGDVMKAVRVHGEIVLRQPAAAPELAYFLYRPPHVRESAPVVVSVHGITRNACEHALYLRPWADAYGAVLAAPLFDRCHYPAYQRVGAERRGNAEAAFNAMLADIEAELERPIGRISLAGYSGGAQFAHRYAFRNPQRVAALALGAAGWYTWPDSELDYPLGLGRSSPQLSINLPDFLRLPIAVYVGELDALRDAKLKQTARLDALQGTTRLERARRWVDALGEAGTRLGIDTRATFEVLYNVDHSFLRCVSRGGFGRRVFESFFGTRPGARERLDHDHVRFQLADRLGAPACAQAPRAVSR